MPTDRVRLALDIPRPLRRTIKSVAADRGMTMLDFITFCVEQEVGTAWRAQYQDRFPGEQPLIKEELHER